MSRTQKIVARVPVKTEHGNFIAHYSEAGLAQLDFPSSRSAKQSTPDSVSSAQIGKWHKQTSAALEQALANKSIAALPPLDLEGGTEFQRKVWGVLRKITNGRTITYSELAVRVGKPKAARAVGSACGANPIPVLIPCHRVLASNGKLGGFSGGLDWKERLLTLEKGTLL